MWLAASREGPVITAVRASHESTYDTGVIITIHPSLNSSEVELKLTLDHNEAKDLIRAVEAEL